MVNNKSNKHSAYIPFQQLITYIIKDYGFGSSNVYPERGDYKGEAKTFRRKFGNGTRRRNSLKRTRTFIIYVEHGE